MPGGVAGVPPTMEAPYADAQSFAKSHSFDVDGVLTLMDLISGYSLTGIIALKCAH
jgi:hypothetical protein